LQRHEAGELSLENALQLVRRAISLGATAARQRLLDAEFKPKKLLGDEI
jgi:exonuclease VII small subunit